MMQHASKTKKKECKWHKISTLLFEDSNNKACSPNNVNEENDEWLSSSTGAPVLTASSCHFFQSDKFNFPRNCI
jgi:hypothetical protein